MTPTTVQQAQAKLSHQVTNRNIALGMCADAQRKLDTARQALDAFIRENAPELLQAVEDAKSSAEQASEVLESATVATKTAMISAYEAGVQNIDMPVGYHIRNITKVNILKMPELILFALTEAERGTPIESLIDIKPKVSALKGREGELAGIIEVIESPTPSLKTK